MTVSELIQRLQQLPYNATVFYAVPHEEFERARSVELVRNDCNLFAHLQKPDRNTPGERVLDWLKCEELGNDEPEAIVVISYRPAFLGTGTIG